MKKVILLFLLLLMPLYFYAQHFSLTVNSKNIQADSVHIQAFDAKKNFQNILSAPYSENTVIKQKDKLAPGLYRVTYDSTEIFDLLISEEKRQNLTVTVVSNDSVRFENSDENNKFIAYNKITAEYDRQAQELNATFEDARKTMPQYMLQNLVKNLVIQMDSISEAKKNYQLRVINENPGLLLASVVQFSMDLPRPPQNYYNNSSLMGQYYAEHAYDNFPFADERMANVPATFMSLREYCGTVFYMDPQAAAQFIDNLLNKARVDSKIYHTFFDYFERVFGTLTSPYWTEDIYRSMLKNALSYDQIDPKRIEYYKTVLELHSKNLPGTHVPDFKIRWADGTESSLYDIKSDYLLLYFQNPDCPTCTEVRGILDKNQDLDRAIQSGKLKVVTIYFEQDEDLWQRYLTNKANPKYLHGWEFENRIEKEQLYDIRIIPFMFLLDKDKKVIKKDIYYNEISEYLKRYNIQ